MRYAVLGDIHGNLEAFSAVLDALASERIDRYLCVGDVVGYGADSVAVVRHVKDKGFTVVAGNHDWAAVDLCETIRFSEHAHKAIVWVKSIIGDVERIFLSSLKLTYTDDALELVHGSMYEPQDFRYLRVLEDAKSTFGLIKRQLCFVGHTHRPGIFCQAEERFFYEFGERLELDDRNKYIVNVGSVGQPRDGNPDSAYCIYDTETRVVDIKRVKYDITKAQHKILKSGLPVFLAERLAVGR